MTSIQSKLGLNWSFQIGWCSSAKQVEVGLPVCSDILSFWRRVSFSAHCPHRFPSGSTSLFAYRGNKPANSPKGQPPDADGHSSVTDLANSLTGDMVMVRRFVPPHTKHINVCIYADEILSLLVPTISQVPKTNVYIVNTYVF